MGSPQPRRPPRRFPGRSRCPARAFRSANSRSGTSRLWPSCWTARRSPRRRWSSAGHPDDKRFLGFVETDIENEQVGDPVLGRAGPRCFPGASGDRRWRGSGRPCGRPSATAVSRHKRENVVSYLAKREQPVGSVSSAPTTVRSTTRPSPPSSRSSMSWRIGTNRRQDLGRPGRDPDVASPRRVWRLGRSLKTTNGLESINALIEERCAKVDHWQNSSERWLATALIEPRLRKVMGGTCPGFVTHRHDDIEDESRVSRSRGEFQLGMGLTLFQPDSA